MQILQFPLSSRASCLGQGLQTQPGRLQLAKSCICSAEKQRTSSNAPAYSSLSRADYGNQSFRVGDLVLGTVRSATGNTAIIDLGGGVTGLLHISEVSHERTPSLEGVLHAGSKLKAIVLKPDRDREMHVKLSTKELEPTPGDMLRNPRLVFERAEETAKQLKELALSFKVGNVAQGVVQSIKPYGALIDLGSIKGLLGRDQISHEEVPEGSVERYLAKGQQIKVMILSQDLGSVRMQLSTKELEPTPGDMLRNPELVFEKAEETAELFKKRALSFQVGQVVRGVVRSTVPYAAFVDLGGIIGVLRHNRISYEEIVQGNVERFLAEGQELTVMILSQDRVSGRVELTTRELESIPGDMLRNPELVVETSEEMAKLFRKHALSMQVGDVVQGVVQNVTAHCAYVDLGCITGQLSRHHISHNGVARGNVKDFLPVGSELKVLIQHHDQDSGLVTLNTKDLEPTPGDMLLNPGLVFARAEEMGERLRKRKAAVHAARCEWKGEVGDVLQGSVKAVQSYGAFIDLGGGVTGLLRGSNISSERVPNAEKLLWFSGYKLKVMIISRDVEAQRVELSTKELEPTPGDMLHNPVLVDRRAGEIMDEQGRARAASQQELGTNSSQAASEQLPTSSEHKQLRAQVADVKLRNQQLPPQTIYDGIVAKLKRKINRLS